MSEHQPWLSITIPSYNYEQYLPECVSSILTQGVDDIEVVIVDDCSTDDSLAVARRLALDDSRIRVFANEQNVGTEKTLIFGFSQLRGKFLTFACADNYYLPGYFRFVKNYLGQRPEIDVIYNSWMFLDGKGRIYRAHHGSHGSATHKPSQLRNIASYDDRNELADLIVNNAYMGDPIFRAELLALQGWSGHPDARAVSDYEFMLSLAASHARIAYVNVSAGVDRFHGGNLRFSRSDLASQTALFRGILHVFEKFVTEENADKLRFRIDDIIARANELIGHYRTVPEIWSELGPRAERVVERLSTALTNIAKAPRKDPVAWRRVSVIVPVYGADLVLLADTLRSVAQQEYDDWEIVAVGHTAYDLRPFFQTLPFAARIRYYEQCEWINRAAARNVGLKMARGQIMTYLDEGNTMRPGHLSALVAALDGSGQPVARTGGTLSLYERPPLDGAVASQFYSDPVLLSSEPLPGPAAPWSTHVRNDLPLNAVAHHRNCVAIAGYFDEALPVFEDWDFVVRLTRQFNVAITAAQSLDVRIVVNDLPNAMLDPALPARTSLTRLYSAYPAAEVPEVAQRREDTLAGEAAATAAGPASSVRFLAGLAG